MISGKSLLLILGTFLLGVFMFSSCKEIFDKKFISEGTIEYDVEYVGADDDNFMVQLMPKTMTCHFKDNKVSMDLNGGMGLFKTTYIFDSEEFTFIQLVKMIQKKYASKLDSTQAQEFDTEFPVMLLEHTNEVKEIAGYNCKKVIVNFENPEIPSFDIYYTDDINIKNPNWCNKFKEIDGVLMEYRMKKYNLEMKVTASKVIKEPIDDSVFDLPEDYKLVSQDEIDNLFIGI